MTEHDTRGALARWLDRMFPDRTLGIVGALDFLIILFFYLKTVSPTVSFWDCGEFVACSYTLGIAHPPGSPLFLLIGRIFTLFPTATDLALRVNIVSSISSAAAATVAFFVLARLITWWSSDRYPDPDLPLAQRLAIYAGSACGSMFFAFATTNWSNSVEAEVYGLAGFLMMIIIWLAMIWVGKRNEPGSDRYLVAISYLALLSVGVHLTVFLVMPSIFLLVITLSRRLRRDPRFWITGIVLFLVTGGVVDFLWGSGIWLVVTGLAAVSVRKRTQWTLAFAMMFVALLGWSVQLYIPIRSELDPTIDQNDPETWASFRDYLERKQYGSESMFDRALTRRAEWANQFGQHERMGFWGFFDREYGFNDQFFFPLFILGLAGLFQLIRRRRMLGLFLITLLLVSSVGLIWYMNFADGTKYNAATQDAYLEVRDRDYFFTPAFILFGMAIGLGGAALIGWLSSGSTRWSAFGAAVIAILPARAIMANYHTNDRSHNYIAYDYACNILNSCDSTAVVFTNGDNDTFPVWCLQEVYGLRKDVRIANLSLLNTHWYIKQLRDDLHVPMRLTDQEIDRMVHYKRPDGEIKRIQDQMIDEILNTNKWQEPVDFAVTVSQASRQYQDRPIDSNLLMIGLVSRLVQSKGHQRCDVKLMGYRLDSVFQWRGLNDPRVYKDDNTQRLIENYNSTFLIVADSLRRAGDIEGAEHYAKMSVEILPGNEDGYMYLGELYADYNLEYKLDSLRLVIANAPVDRDRVETSFAYAYKRAADTLRGLELLKEILVRNPKYQQAYRGIVQFYYELGQYDTLLAFMEDWVAKHPDDQDSEKLLGQVRELTDRLKKTAEAKDSAAAAEQAP